MEKIPKLSPFASWHGSTINLEQPIPRSNFYGSKDGSNNPYLDQIFMVPRMARTIHTSIKFLWFQGC